MGLLKNISDFAKSVKYGKQEDLFQQDRTVENTLQKLKTADAHPDVIACAQSGNIAVLNLYEFASGSIMPSDLVEMASLMNSSRAFNAVAPLASGTAWVIVKNMAQRCTPPHGPKLLTELERKDLLQKLIQEHKVGGTTGTDLFYENFTGGLGVKEASDVLRSSAAFQLIKSEMYFQEQTYQEYPQFKPLL